MSHGDSVAYRDRREYDGRPACHGDSLLYCIYNLIQIHVSRNDLIIRTDDPYQRTVHLFLCKPQRIEQ